MNLAMTETWNPTPVETDGDLVDRAKAGETDAIDALAKLHRHSAYVFALQLVGNRDDAMDVAQDSILRFLGTLDRFDSSRPVRPWLFTIVRNRVKDLWRQRSRRGERSLNHPELGDLGAMIVDLSADPGRDLRVRELQRQVWRSISKLPDAKREILVLRDFHDHSYAEIAEILSIPIGTVMSRLHGARRQLRSHLEPYFHAGKPT